VAHDDNTHEEVGFASKLREFGIELSSLLHTLDRMPKNQYLKAQDMKAPTAYRAPGLRSYSLWGEFDRNLFSTPG